MCFELHKPKVLEDFFLLFKKTTNKIAGLMGFAYRIVVLGQPACCVYNTMILGQSRAVFTIQ